MSEMICDDDIRDGHPCVPLLPSTSFSRQFAENWPDHVLVRVTPHDESWWDLDDLCRAAVKPEGAPYTNRDWFLVTFDAASRIIAAFDIIGKLDRLEFMRVTP